MFSRIFFRQVSVQLSKCGVSAPNVTAAFIMRGWPPLLLYSPSSASQGIVGKSCRSERGGMIQILLDVISCYRKIVEDWGSVPPFDLIMDHMCCTLLFYQFIHKVITVHLANGSFHSAGFISGWNIRQRAPQKRDTSNLLIIICLQEKIVSVTLVGRAVH